MEGGGRTPGHPEKSSRDLLLQTVTCAPWVGLPGGRVLQGGWESEGYSQHPAPRIWELSCQLYTSMPHEGQEV